MAYTVKLLQFEGPLDLLLQLIEKEKLDITEVSLSKITAEYLTYIDQFKVKTDQLSEFLGLSSRLLYLKSKALLPSLKNEEEEEDIEKLKAQLKEYKKYKAAAQSLRQILEDGRFGHSAKGKSRQEIAIFEPEGIELENLMAIFQKVIRRMPEETSLKEETIESQITIEERYAEIEIEVKRKGKLSLQALLRKARTKTEAIVTFLALLEMIKQKVVSVRQDSNFSDVIVTRLK